MMSCTYYCYDIPAALKSQIDDYMNKPSNFETSFAMLYTIYSIPNIILPFCSGYIVDHYGFKLCLFLFSSFILSGQIVFCFGLQIKSWIIMFVGRFIFSLGARKLILIVLMF